ncbi:MAG: HugZ family protein [Dongiaceae bacterium]
MSSNEPTPAEAARRLLLAADRAVLSTRLAKAPDTDLSGWPYGSLVLLAMAEDGAPLLLLSDLAEHAKNIAADPRIALLIDGTAGLADPLTGSRVTVLGRAEKSADARLTDRFVTRHPSAKRYAGFADFHPYRIAIAGAHLVAGFGRIHWIPAKELTG